MNTLKQNNYMEKKIRFERKWAMPNRWTFTIEPIVSLLKEEVSGVWVDPFAGKNGKKYARYTNDIEMGGWMHSLGLENSRENMMVFYMTRPTQLHRRECTGKKSLHL
jgi:hypothetical protein